ncbi:MAG TPA: ABC transporter permease [Phycisphaerae bacterium]|nr:ABC transporter permease [Phycisphaerae bacterium]
MISQEAARTGGTDRPFKAALTRLAQRREYGVGFLLAATLIAVSWKNPAFASAANLSDLLVQCAPAVIVGCGLTFVIVTGEIDISVGSLLGLLAAVMGLACSPQRANWPVVPTVLATLLAGTASGFLTGALVTFGRAPSIIITLGMLTALRGLTELLMGGEWITDLPAGLRTLGTGSLLGIPISVLVAAVVVVGSALLAGRTALGLQIYAVGSNPEAARLAGLSIRRLRLFAFTLTGLLTAVAALVSVPQLSVIESGVGKGFELLVVTCVVVGGTSIRGGSGGILGTVLAVLLLGIVRTVLVFLKLGEMATYWERAIQGGFVLAAVLADHLARRSSAARAAGGQT